MSRVGLWVIGMALGMGVRCSCAPDKPHPEPYSAKHPTPTFSDLNRAALARGLYDLYQKSGGQCEGASVLLKREVWEPWKSMDARNVVLTRAAVSHEDLIKQRDKALTYVIDLAQIMLRVVETGKCDKTVTARIQIADAGIQSEFGVGLCRPCKVPDRGLGLTNADLSLQEQWSLLKVYALVFRHFAETVVNYYRGIPEGWGAVDYFGTSMVTKYTAMFTSDGEVSPHVLGDYCGKGPSGVDGNILFAPRIATNAVVSFKRLLGEIQEFVGTDGNSWLARDTRNIIIYWHVTLVSLLQAFDTLHRLEETKGNEKSKHDKINFKLLPWGRQSLARPLEDIFNGWLKHTVTEIELLMRRNHWMKMLMFFDVSLQQKYAVLFLLSSHLLLLAHKISKSLNGVQALDHAAQVPR
jgi:hypothetical protein